MILTGLPWWPLNRREEPTDQVAATSDTLSQSGSRSLKNDRVKQAVLNILKNFLKPSYVERVFKLTHKIIIAETKV